jgi:hypothetical protein
MLTPPRKLRIRTLTNTLSSKQSRIKGQRQVQD